MSESNSRDGDAYFLDEFQPGMPEPDEKLRPWKGETRVVGKGLPRVDAYERVSGVARFTFDVSFPDMLHTAILRCPHAHAMVKNVDTGTAEKMPGVRAVITGNTPGTDIPWYGGRNPQSKLFDPHCRYAGEEVAAVAAETPQQAWDGVRAIEVEYEELPFAADVESSLRQGAPEIQPGGNRLGEPSVTRRGDVQAGFAEADLVLEETFTVGTHIHVPMETFGSVAKWDGDSLTIWDSTQGVFSVMFSVARALKLPYNKVRVICKYMGGGFGAKLYTGKYTVIAVLLARSTGRPVKLMLTREESFLSEGNRPGAKLTIKGGVKRDGTLTALQLTTVGSPGAYSGRGLDSTQVGELYKCPNIQTEQRLIYTNAGNSRAMRAPGRPQCSWALEQMMDMLAGGLGMDPLEVRLRNIPTFSQMDERKRPFTSIGLKDCLTEGAKAFGWEEDKAKGKGNGHVRRGVGVAAGVWDYGMGGPPSTAIVKMFVDGSVSIRTGAMDIGTGTKTIACMIAAEELNVPLERVQIENADTGTTPFSGGSGGSMTLPTVGPTVRQAAAKVKKQLLEWGSEDLEVPVEDLELLENAVVSRSDPEKKKSIPQLIRSRNQLDVVGVGYRGPNPDDKVIKPFGAQFAEVEVNTLTGEVRLLRMVGAHDSGRVINRKTYDNQVLGGMTQGVGFGMTEHRVLDRQTGKMCNANWHDYRIPTALDVPFDHEVLAIDPGDEECNNIGAKGLGEPPVIPTGAAIANAVYDAIGVRVTDAPIYPPRILELLAGKGKRG